MYFVYLDEAGNTGTHLENKDQPIHYISGIVIKYEDMQKIEKSIKNLLPNFLPHSQNFNFEFHGKDMFAGKSHFKKFKIEERLQAFKDLVSIFKNYNLSFFCQGIDKKKHQAKYLTPYHPHNVAFMYLIEKIDRFLSEEKRLGFVIMDKCKDVEQKIINDFDMYREKGTPFGFSRDIKQFVDNVAYVDSYNSYLLQLADVIGYIVTSTHTDNFLKKKKKFFKESLSKLAESIKPQCKYFDIEPKKAS